MAAGRIAETSGRLEAARDAYLAAAALDAEYTAAAEAARRVTGQIADLAFSEAMSRALADIDAGRFTAAGRGLDVASRLRPGDRAVADARRRLAASRQSAELSRLRSGTARKETAEEWHEAEALYRRALKVDASASFARAGLVRAESRARLHDRLDHYLADPSRLHSPGPLAEAGQLLAAAVDPGSEPKLQAKTARLARLVAAAKMPRAVTLRSDGLTEVTIYHVGRLGTFAEQRLELRPGSYTAVGARAGYRDVRVHFSVVPDAPLAAIDIRCTETL